MNRAPLQQRIEFYSLLSAQIHFTYALEAFEAYLKYDDATPDWLRQSMLTAFLVNYMKPFQEWKDKKLKLGLRIDKSLVPQRHIATHESLATLRDKMFAHTDFGSLMDSGGKPLHALCLIVKGHTWTYGLRIIHPLAPVVPKVTKLLKELIRITGYKSDNIQKKWMKKLHLSDGLWKLNAGELNDDIFCRL